MVINGSSGGSTGYEVPTCFVAVLYPLLALVGVRIKGGFKGLVYGW